MAIDFLRNTVRDPLEKPLAWLQLLLKGGPRDMIFYSIDNFFIHIDVF